MIRGSGGGDPFQRPAAAITVLPGLISQGKDKSNAGTFRAVRADPHRATEGHRPLPHSGESKSPLARNLRRKANAVILDLKRDPVACRCQADIEVAGLRVLGNVVQSFLHRAVERDLESMIKDP